MLQCSVMPRKRWEHTYLWGDVQRKGNILRNERVRQTKILKVS